MLTLSMPCNINEFLLYRNLIYIALQTHWGQVTTYGNIDLVQY